MRRTTSIFGGSGLLQTQNFGHHPDTRYLTGVVFNDLDADDFYMPDIGESLAGYIIEAVATDSFQPAHGAGKALWRSVQLPQDDREKPQVI